MRFSTRARYGLRLMVELCREAKGGKPVNLNRIARITGLSENYLAQLVIPLKNDGLLIGVSGKNGGYVLARLPEEISLNRVITALMGPINLAECANNPHICLNSCFCETRMIWVILNHRINEVLDQYSLKDLVDKSWMAEMRKKYPEVPFLDADINLDDIGSGEEQGCPVIARPA